MAKLSKTQIANLKKVGITKVATVEDAEKEMRLFLAGEEIDGTDDQGFDDLMDYCEAFMEEEEDEDEEAEEEDEDIEEDDDDEDDEDIEEDEDEDIEEDDYDALAEESEEAFDFEKMTIKKVRAHIVEKGIAELVALKGLDKKDLIKVANGTLEVKAKKATPTKATPTKVKAATKKAKAGVKEVIPSVTKKKVSTKTTVAFDPRNVEEHDDMIAEMFPNFADEEEYFVKRLKQGFTVRRLFDNTKPTVLNYDDLKVDSATEEPTLIGNAYFNRFDSIEDLSAFLPEEWKDREIGMFRSETHPSIKRVTNEELIWLLENTDILAESLKRAGVTDKTMAKNRKSLEKTVAEKRKVDKPTAKKKVVTKKKIAPKKVVEEEVDEDEDEEIATPVKKKKKKKKKKNKKK